MAAPKFRISLKNKDGKPFTYTDYKGNEVTTSYLPIGAAWEGKFGGLDIKLDRKVTIDPAVHFVNAMAVKPRGEEGDEEAPKTSARKGGSKKQESNDDPFA
jgi:hypothetical protein